jgi:intein/homing endonuclease
MNDITIRKRHHSQKYDIDFSWFENANTEEFAYFLGFFYADGYNNEKQIKIAIVLKEQDKEILEKFSNLFFGNRPIRTYNIACQTNKNNAVCSLVVGNKELTKMLSSFGAPQNKTFKIRFPVWLHKDLYRHFIRGYFDGDGSCMKCKNQYRISIASNIEFNSQLKEIVKEYTNLEFDLRPHGKITTLYKGGNKNTIIFLNWLYDNSTIYLQRKYDRYKELLDVRKAVQKIEDSYTHVFYCKPKNKWVSRLPNKYGRKWIGGFGTKEEAIQSYKNHPLINSN